MQNGSLMTKNFFSSILMTMLCVFLTFYSGMSHARIKQMPLPPDRAFVFSVSLQQPQEIVAEWRIAPGYYLYKKHMKITFTPAIPVQFSFPKGEWKQDFTHKQVEVYSGKLNVPIQVQSSIQQVQLRVEYQGCSKDGFCYPPMHATLLLNLARQSNESVQPIPSIQSLATSQNDILSLLRTQHIGIMLLLFAGLGILLAFTPCVLPMIPILTGIILGQKHAAGTRKAFMLSLTYVLGMAITYAGAGLVAASIGGSIQVWLQKPLIISLTSLLFVFLGISLFGVFDLRFPHRWQNKIFSWSDKHEGGTYVGVLFMGILSTLIVSPCITAPIVGVLIFISETGNQLLGASALFVMGLGMGIPLIMIGMSAGKWLPKSGPWMKTVKATFGLLMMSMAIWILSRILSPMMTKTLWGVMTFIIALFFGFYVPHHIGQYRFNRGLGIVIGFFGLIMMLGGMGVSTFLDKWVSLPGVSQSTTQLFSVVHNVDEIKQQLMLAQAEHHPVILDFYADWCESCVAMDRNVFSLSKVRQALGSFILLRADLSNNSLEDEKIMKEYGVIAPPTMLFFTNEGQEVNSRRLVGEMNAEEFLTRINAFMTLSCYKNVQC